MTIDSTNSLLVVFYLTVEQIITHRCKETVNCIILVALLSNFKFVQEH